MGKFQIEKCGEIDGLYLIQPTVFGDSRGYFMETYNYEEFKEAGLDKPNPVDAVVGGDGE